MWWKLALERSVAWANSSSWRKSHKSHVLTFLSSVHQMISIWNMQQLLIIWGKDSHEHVIELFHWSLITWQWRSAPLQTTNHHSQSQNSKEHALLFQIQCLSCAPKWMKTKISFQCWPVSLGACTLMMCNTFEIEGQKVLKPSMLVANEGLNWCSSVAFFFSIIHCVKLPPRQQFSYPARLSHAVTQMLRSLVFEFWCGPASWGLWARENARHEVKSLLHHCDST